MNPAVKQGLGVLAAAIIAAWLVQRATRGKDVRDLGYADHGRRDQNTKAQSILSPDYLIGYHHVAHPIEMEANILLGHHPLYTRESTLSPNCSGVAKYGWTFSPPSEENL